MIKETPPQREQRLAKIAAMHRFLHDIVGVRINYPESSTFTARTATRYVPQDLDEIPDKIESIDNLGWESLFHCISQEQLEVMICLYLGLNPSETVEVLDFPNIARYYNVSNKLRKVYRLKKGQFVD